MAGGQARADMRHFGRALFVNKDADSNGKDLTVNQKCLDITHLE